jgi:hypothetical protein
VSKEKAMQNYKDLEIYQLTSKTQSAERKAQSSKRKTQGAKGVSLIIVIFAMMLLAVLGWSLAVLQSTDFESSLRQVDSERALYLAESGAQWGLRQLKDDFSCSTAIWGSSNPRSVLHGLSFGQYRLICTCEEAGNPPGCNTATQITLISTGYIPLESNFRSQRQIELVVDQGAFAAAGSVRNLFDWSGILAGSDIDGDLRAGHFNGDGDGTYDELCEDYGEEADCGSQLPPGDGLRTQGTTTIPPINMSDFEANASQIWDLGRESTIEAILPNNRIRVADNIFTPPASQWANVTAARNLDIAGWPDTDTWRIITQRVNNQIVELESNAGWSVGERIRIVKLFSGNNNNQGLWYIKGDVVIDARTDNARFKKTSLVAEGDIAIKGSERLSMDAYVEPSVLRTFPNLATENGNIYSPDSPDAGSNGRRFRGLIYTENGDVLFNYINGTAIMGDNVTLEGLVELNYAPKYIDDDGFLGALSVINWREK